ncbi:MAG: phosphohydrolase [Treponema sp.]|nr:phosphohydrolase [Treponema sp.]
MATFEKIACESIKEGVRFSAPVFFDDGKNMFLAEGKAAKPYHIAAIKRWKLPFLLTYGHMLDAAEIAKAEAVADEAGELEAIDDLEPLEAVDDL